MKVLKILLTPILFIWQLPQHLLATVLITLNIKKFKEALEHKTSTVYIFSDLDFTGVSLGMFILLSEKCIASDGEVVKHEYGHSVQSLMFGWLYLLVIGIPSFINHQRSKNDAEVYKNYYNLYPEKWADKLGGVKR